MSNQPETIPIYRRIENGLRRHIQDGRWQPGMLLPTRRALAAEYNVDLNTLQRAITILMADGTLTSHPRRGTVVADRHAAENGHTPRNLPEPRTSFTLGILVPYWLTSSEDRQNWVYIITSALECRFAAAGGTTHLINAGDLLEERAAGLRSDLSAINSLLTQDVDALAIILPEHNNIFVDEVLAAAVPTHIPLVVVTHSPLDRPISHIFYDQETAGYQAAHHLLAKGYQALTIFPPHAEEWAIQRIAGARKAVEHAKRPDVTLRVYPEDEDIGRCPFVTEQERIGYDLGRRMLTEKLPERTGIIAINDTVAYGFIKAASEIGLTAGRDFGLVGFDDSPQAALRGLTSLRPPLEAMGMEAARLLLSTLRGEMMMQQVRLRSHLIPRASTQAPR